VYKLIISNPKVEDTGKYTIEIGGIACTAYLDVEGKSVLVLFENCNLFNVNWGLNLSWFHSTLLLSHD
jgi:hypothetical protein